MRKLKICQVTPGLIEITKANSWGAIERVIANWTEQLRLLGHQVDIKYLNEVDNSYDIIHIHTGNLGIEASKRNIPYFFSMHDHHVLLRPNISEENKLAIDKSLLTIVFGKNIINHFQQCNNIVYLSHGVDNTFFIPQKNNTFSKRDLLCVANNGLSGDSSIDRKGFIVAAQVAEKLGLSITFAGPTNSNKEFFEIHKDKFKYNKINFIYDLDENQLKEIYQNHKIFLHPSDLEAGHPNLTILEALSCGLPIVGTYEGDKELKGMIVSPINVDVIANNVIKIQNNYEKYSNEAILTGEKYSWKNIVKNLEAYYYSELNRQSMKNSLVFAYNNLEKTNKIIDNKIEIKYLDGAKVEIKGNENKEYNIEFINKDNNNLAYKTNLRNNCWAMTDAKYFVNWEININDKKFELDLKDKKVLISFDSSALGDNLAWIPYVEEFRKKHQCEVFVSTFWNNIFENSYKELRFLEPGISPEFFYAWYKIGCWDNDYSRNKTHWRTITLQQIACDCLGLEYDEIKPKLNFIIKPSEIKNKYVAISTTSTLYCKLWNYPNGWQFIVDYLRSKKYDVMVIQKEPTNLINVYDKTNTDIETSLNNILQSEFLIGLGSGTSWAAWALNKPVILISGFSEKYSEFYTPHRIINENVCHGCYNDISFEYERGNYMWCPKKKDFECSKEITPMMVINEIDKLIKN